MFKILYLPTAEEVETPDWLYNTKEAYLYFINDPETRFYISTFFNSNALPFPQMIRRIRYTQVRPGIQHLRLGNEIDKYLLEIVEVENV